MDVISDDGDVRMMEGVLVFKRRASPAERDIDSSCLSIIWFELRKLINMPERRDLKKTKQSRLF